MPHPNTPDDPFKVTAVLVVTAATFYLLIRVLTTWLG